MHFFWFNHSEEVRFWDIFKKAFVFSFSLEILTPVKFNGTILSINHKNSEFYLNAKST